MLAPLRGCPSAPIHRAGEDSPRPRCHVEDRVDREQQADAGKLRTATNAAGQTLVPTIVAKREGILDLDRYRAPRGADPLREDEPAATLAPAA